MADLRTLPLLWDELVDAHGVPRPAAAALVERLRSLDIEELQQRQALAEVDILALGSPSPSTTTVRAPIERGRWTSCHG